MDEPRNPWRDARVAALARQTTVVEAPACPDCLAGSLGQYPRVCGVLMTDDGPCGKPVRCAGLFHYHRRGVPVRCSVCGILQRNTRILNNREEPE